MRVFILLFESAYNFDPGCEETIAVVSSQAEAFNRAEAIERDERRDGKWIVDAWELDGAFVERVEIWPA